MGLLVFARCLSQRVGSAVHSARCGQQAYQEIFRVLFELLPEARQSGVFTNDRECGPVQNMSRIWQVSSKALMSLLPTIFCDLLNQTLP